MGLHKSRQLLAFTIKREPHALHSNKRQLKMQQRKILNAKGRTQKRRNGKDAMNMKCNQVSLKNYEIVAMRDNFNIWFIE